jgi:hypothetical protein
MVERFYYCRKHGVFCCTRASIGFPIFGGWSRIGDFLVRLIAQLAHQGSRLCDETKNIEIPVYDIKAGERRDRQFVFYSV